MICCMSFGLINCSVMDNEDEKAIEQQIDSSTIPPGDKKPLVQFKILAANRAAKIWLRGRKPNERVGKVVCTVERGGRISTSTSPTELLVSNMITCLLNTDTSYAGCLQSLGKQLEELARIDIASTLGSITTNTSIKCKLVIDHPFQLDKVPPSINPNQMSTTEAIDAIVSMDAPPPWLVLIPENAPLFIILCPLNAKWSCPPNPTKPGQPTPNPVTPGGDHVE